MERFVSSLLGLAVICVTTSFFSAESAKVLGTHRLDAKNMPPLSKVRKQLVLQSL
jgi:hypothetical protein